MEETNMNKLGYVIAALGAIAIAAPSIASAETVVVRHGDRGHSGARAEMHRNHGWHRDHGMRHHDRMIVVRHPHHEG
jgi:hypothetical protein